MEQMSYALQAIIGEFLKLIVLIVLFYLAGQLPMFLISFAILASIRAFAGGYHATTVMKCLVTSILFFIITVGVGVYMESYVYDNRLWLLAVSLLIIAIKAPIPSAHRQITDMNRYYRLKGISIVIALFWTILLFKGYPDPTLCSVGTVTILLEAIQLFKRNLKKGEPS